MTTRSLMLRMSGCRSQAAMEKRTHPAAAGGAVAVAAVVPTGKAGAARPRVRGRQVVAVPSRSVPVAAVVGESVVGSERRRDEGCGREGEDEMAQDGRSFQAD